MLQSKLFTKTTRLVPKDELSINAQLLIKAGFIDKLMAGVYTYLPLGLRVLRKIENIVREEIAKIGGQEILMPALHPKENWETTGRWATYDPPLFNPKGVGEKDYVLAPTHEEVVSPLAKKIVFSYKDLPFYFFQIQTKFRNEARAKSGLLRLREFSMKDLYSFHADTADLDKYYDKVVISYTKIFARLGLKEKTYLTAASGGTFSKYSHEFQTECPTGEDTIYICEKCQLAINKEIKDENPVCPKCQSADFRETKAVEVGNIFKLGTKYSAPFDLKYKDQDGQEQPVIMGCYGMGPSRVMGTIVEVSHDAKGMIWPKEVAPYQIHLVALKAEGKLAKEGDKLYTDLTTAGFEVLYDDRLESAGVKLNDCDLLGLPIRLIFSAKTAAKSSVEVKRRNEDKVELVPLNEVAGYLKKELA